jgi:hypothetical protein
MAMLEFKHFPEAAFLPFLLPGKRVLGMEAGGTKQQEE